MAIIKRYDSIINVDCLLGNYLKC